MRRAPDYSWERPTGQQAQVWVNERMRGVVVVEWCLDGVFQRECDWPTTQWAREFVENWKQRETRTMMRLV